MDDELNFDNTDNEATEAGGDIEADTDNIEADTDNIEADTDNEATEVTQALALAKSVKSKREQEKIAEAEAREKEAQQLQKQREASETNTNNEDFIEPSAREQIKEQEDIAEKTRIIKQVKTELFARTGLKVADDDPVLQLVVILKSIAEDQLEAIFNNIEANTDNLTDNLLFQLEEVGKVIADKQKEVGSKAIRQQSEASEAITRSIKSIDEAFKDKLDELKTLLNKLEKQKEQIINDVWGKLEQRITHKIQNELTKDIKTIAENSNNSINNQRMLLVGGVGGLIIGLILCALILAFFVR